MRTYDVAIIGGGIIGVSIAFELAAEKIRVVVIDRQAPGREASWAAAGMLSPAPDSPRDLPLAPFAQESLRVYPRFVEAIEEASNYPSTYRRDGALEVFFFRDAQRECEERMRDLRRLGIAAESIAADAAQRMDTAISRLARAALWLPEEGTVEPRMLMDALIAAARNRGVEIRAGCEVSRLSRDNGRCMGVIAGGEKISSSHVILAAGCFSAGIANEPRLKHLAPTRPVRGQMLALRPADCAGPRLVVRSELGYVLPRKDGRIVAGSTIEEAGFEKAITAGGLSKILNGSIEMCPPLSGAKVVETWAGLRPGTPDDLPILGPCDVAGLWIATGHYRNGILLAAATAKLFRSFILGAAPPFDADRFSPMRFERREMRARTAV